MIAKRENCLDDTILNQKGQTLSVSHAVIGQKLQRLPRLVGIPFANGYFDYTIVAAANANDPAPCASSLHGCQLS